MSQTNNRNIHPEQQDQILFAILVQHHQQIALKGLGEEQDSAAKAGKRDLSTVKYAIDTLSMLETFTAGNLTEEMSEYLSKTLDSLRLKYEGANNS